MEISAWCTLILHHSSRFKAEQKKCGFHWKCPGLSCLFQGDRRMYCKFFFMDVFIGHSLSLGLPVQMTTPWWWRQCLFPRLTIYRRGKSFFFPLAQSPVSLCFSQFYPSTPRSDGSHCFLGLQLSVTLGRHPVNCTAKALGRASIISRWWSLNDVRIHCIILTPSVQLGGYITGECEKQPFLPLVYPLGIPEQYFAACKRF